MSATTKLTRMEGRLFLREPIGLFFGLLFPALLLLGLGSLFPGFGDPAPELDGRRYIDVYAPVSIVFGLAMLGLATFPPTLATYREFGILRRLRTTPLSPVRLLSAQMLVQGSVAVLAGAGVIAVAAASFDVSLPSQPLWFLLCWILAAVAMFGTGMLIGSLVRTSQTAVAIGMAVFFPMLFFAGLWIPRELMSDTLRALSDFTPLGAAVQAMGDSWYGVTPSLLHMGVLVVYSVVVGLAAVRFFKWE
ncbi:MAG: ABC transporter permease [Acidimicrobiia bacterium]